MDNNCTWRTLLKKTNPKSMLALEHSWAVAELIGSLCFSWYKGHQRSLGRLSFSELPLCFWPFRIPRKLGPNHRLEMSDCNDMWDWELKAERLTLWPSRRTFLHSYKAEFPAHCSPKDRLARLNFFSCCVKVQVLICFRWVTFCQLILPV